MAEYIAYGLAAGAPLRYAKEPAGCFINDFHRKEQMEHKDKIARAKNQVEKLFGPLLAHLKNSRTTFHTMLREHSPDGTHRALVAAVRAEPNGEKGQLYRAWITAALQPLNKRAAEIIRNNAHLLDHGMHPLLLQLLNHVSAYDFTIKRWEENHTAEWNPVRYPDGIVEWAQREFNLAKAR